MYSFLLGERNQLHNLALRHNLNTEWVYFYKKFQPKDYDFSTQAMVYTDIGEEMLQHSFDGKKCLF